MSVLKLNISTARDTSTLQSTFETAGGNRQIANRIVNFITSLLSGSELAMNSSTPPSIAISIQENATQASGTVIFSDHASANDTFLVNGVTFTCVNSGATGNQWNKGANALASAQNLAAAINASATALVSSQVSAAAVDNGDGTATVTITSLNYGVFGNQCTIAKGVDAGTVMTVSGARLTGGAVDATAQTLQF